MLNPFRHVKIYDVVSYDNVHTIDYPASILSIAVSVSTLFVFTQSSHIFPIICCILESR